MLSKNRPKLLKRCDQAKQITNFYNSSIASLRIYIGIHICILHGVEWCWKIQEIQIE